MPTDPDPSDAKQPQPAPPVASEPQEPDSDELVQTDDAVIGRAIRFSLLALLLLALAVGGVIYLRSRPKPVAAPKVTALVAPTKREQPQVEVPAVKFTDITREAGITFTHRSGAYGDKLLPESMGSGVAFLDYDGDGFQDLLFVNGTEWPWHRTEGQPPATAALYHNEAGKGFRDVTAGSGLDVPIYGQGVGVGDYDNDGRPDVFLSAVGEGRLFHNEGGGKFRDVTAEAGVAGTPQDWGTSCAFFDYDHDGKLDLFVCQYVKWSREIDFEVVYKLVGIGRAYGPPTNFEGQFSRLYHNEGGGRFTDVSERAGIQVKNPATGVPVSKALGVAPTDIDGDGWTDLIVANDTVQNFVFHNQKDGTFEEIGALSGVAFDSYGNTRGAMGIDAAHFRNDASLGIGIGNFANEMTALYVSQPGGAMAFTDESITHGVGPAGRLLLKFGLFFFDYDLDGWLDILTSNGHLEDEISKVQASQKYQQPAQLFWNAAGGGKSGYIAVPPEKSGPDLVQPIVGRGSAYADIDNDGDLDAVLTQVNGAPLLLRNDQALGHHWTRFELTGTNANRSAIGATVRVKVGERTLTRQVTAAKSYLSQSALTVTFGLGKSDRVDGAEILWPGGATQRIEQVQIDGRNAVQQAP